MQQLTMKEEEAMRYIWKLQQCYVRDILKEYGDKRPPYTTLASIIKKLERKGYVKGSHRGSIYSYQPVISQSEYLDYFMIHVADHFFGGSCKELVAFLAQKEHFSAEELKEIAQAMEDRQA